MQLKTHRTLLYLSRRKSHFFKSLGSALAHSTPPAPALQSYNRPFYFVPLLLTNHCVYPPFCPSILSFRAPPRLPCGRAPDTDGRRLITQLFDDCADVCSFRRPCVSFQLAQREQNNESKNVVLFCFSKVSLPSCFAPCTRADLLRAVTQSSLGQQWNVKLKENPPTY